jgi:uncharacterized protein involved in outer membrane biogenesis
VAPKVGASVPPEHAMAASITPQQHRPDHAGVAARTGPPRGVRILLGIVVALFVLWLVWDWNWFKPMVERRVEAATGRGFEIAGDLDVDLGFPTVVQADGLRLGNAEWSQREGDMADIGRLELAIRIAPLLGGRIDLPLVAVDRGRVLLERGEDGVANWQFGDPDEAQQDEPGNLPVVREIRVTEGELKLFEAQYRTDLTLRLHSGEAEPGARAPLLAEGEGHYRGEPFELEGRVDSPLDLQDSERPWRVDVSARAGASRARVRGELAAALQLDAFEVQAELSGQDLAHLYPLLGIALPATPPYTLDGRLGREGQTWRYHDFRGTVGSSDLSGDIDIALAGERPMLTADLESSRLALVDLGGFLGADPGRDSGVGGDGGGAQGADDGDDAGRSGSREARNAAAADGSGDATQDGEQAQPAGRVLPHHEYNLSKLRSMDADVQLTAAEVDAPPLPVRTLDGRLRLENGLATIDPLKLGVAGGDVSAWVTMDATREPIATALKLSVRNLDLPKLFPNAELVRDSAGQIAGDADLQGRGNSVAAMLGSANGDLGLIMGPGRISNLLVELAGLDIAEAIGFLLTEDQVIPVRCAYADFGFEDGVASVRQFVVDTSDTVIFGEGAVDFGSEELDIQLRPQPKDRSLIALRTPLIIGGTLADPSFRPAAGGLILRSIAAAALYAAAPPAALLALIEFGPGEDTGCGPDAGQVPEDGRDDGDGEDDEGGDNAARAGDAG